uniref:Uncharacterized protein n=1 Tax=Oryza nivara TaxID=4536 RepID=A0A0E0JAD0_ORYNI
MAAVVPANFGEGGGHGERQWSKGSVVVAAARLGAAGSGSASQCEREHAERQMKLLEAQNLSANASADGEN